MLGNELVNIFRNASIATTVIKRLIIYLLSCPSYVELQPVVKKVKLPTDEEYYEIQLKEIRKFIK
jgi:hypothetical protein